MHCVRVDESPNDVDTARPQKHFPYKLYDMLEYIDRSGDSSAASWSPDGTAFVIRKQDAFMDVVRMFFKQTKFRSFVSIVLLLSEILLL